MFKKMLQTNIGVTVMVAPRPDFRSRRLTRLFEFSGLVAVGRANRVLVDLFVTFNWL